MGFHLCINNVKQDAVLAENVTTCVKQDAVLAENVTTCVKQDAVLAENETTCVKQDAVIAENETTCVKQDTVLAENETTCVKQDTVLAENETTCVKQDAVLAENETTCVKQDAVLAENETTCVKQDAVLAENETTCVKQDTVLAENETTCVKQDAVLAENETTCVKQDAVLAENETLCVEQDSNPAGQETTVSVGLESYSTQIARTASCFTILIGFIFLFIFTMNLSAQDIDLPPIISETDTLDLSYWTQQQEMEVSWVSWLNNGRDRSIKPSIHNRTSAGWAEEKRDVTFSQITTMSYDHLNTGLNTNIPYERKLEENSWSFFCQMKNTGYCRDLVIGDYRIRWGQGLLVGQQNQNSNLFLVPRNQLTRGSFIRGTALQAQVNIMNFLVMMGNNPMYANFEDNHLKRIYSTSINPGCRYISSGNKINGFALHLGSAHASMGFLLMNLAFQDNFTDSLYQRKNQLGSATYSIQTGSLSFQGEYASSNQLDAMIQSIQWGSKGFRQQIEYYQSDAYFPSWLQGNSLHMPNTYCSNVIQYQVSNNLSANLDMNASFFYEKRDVFGTNNISKQNLKLRYHNEINNLLISIQNRLQPSSQANDSTLVHDTLPLDIIQLQWERKLNPQWSIGFTIQDKYYQTNSGIRKHGFYLVNSFGWNPNYVKIQFQVTMLQTKSSVFIPDDDVGINAEQQWQMGDDLSYRLYMQFLKRIPLKLIYKGSFWKGGMEQVFAEMEITF